MLPLLLAALAPTPPPAFTYDSLVQLIRSEKLGSVEQVLPRLPEELRSSYALVYESRSLQGASPLAPRAILFGKDARLACAFNGDASEAGFDTLECYQFRDEARTFELHQIQFPSPSNGLAAPRFSEANHSADGKVSCTRCHAADPRPNWDEYPIWKGAYGTQDDVINSGPSGIQQSYEKFVALRGTHPRYRWLLEPVEPYLPPQGIPEGRYDIGRHPNLRFSALTNRLNALRARRLMERGSKPWQLPAYAAASLLCPLTDAQRTRLESAGIDPDLQALQSSILSQLGIPGNQWTTQIAGDPGPSGPDSWEHYSGFGKLSTSIGMMVVAELASQGNATLRKELDAIFSKLPETFSGKDLAFFQLIDSITPDPFPPFDTLSDAACAELARVFVEQAAP